MTLLPAISIDEALTDPNLLGAALGDMDSWSTWRAVLKAAYAEPMTADEVALFKTLAGGREPPVQRVSELWVIAGRRGGKTRTAGAVGAYAAAFNQHRLAPGETGTVLVLAASKLQAKATRDYAEGFLTASPVLSELIDGEPTTEEIRLKGNVVIATHSANFRTVRSRTMLAAVFDECAFWRDSDTSTNPDTEIYTATLPALATTGGMLIGISSPYRRTGLLFKKYQAAFGQDDPNVLVIVAPSAVLNPTIDPTAIARARQMDPDRARSEWDAEFRDDLSDFFTRVAVDACIEEGVHERPADDFKEYVGFVDPSGGRRDSMVLAIAHKEGETCILDLLREVRPPFNPEAVVAEFTDICRKYRISEVRGDNYAAEWVKSMFDRKGVYYRASDKNRSEIYLESLPRINAHSFKLLANEELVDQMCRLIRIPSRTGRDAVDHPPGGTDDVANAALGALVFATQEAGRIVHRTRREIEDDYFLQHGRRLDPAGADPLEFF